MVRAQTFERPGASAPDNGSALNSFTAQDMYLRKSKTTLQPIQGPLIIGDRTINPASQAQGFFGVTGVNLNASVLGSAGTSNPVDIGSSVPVYGFAGTAGASYGVYGYAEGTGSAGIVGRTGAANAFAGSFYGKVWVTDNGGGELDTGWNATKTGIERSVSAKRFTSIEIDEVGQYLYIGGYSDANNWRIEKRSVLTGQLVSEFDGNGSGPGTPGYAESVNGSWDNRLQDIAVVGDDVFTVGWDNYEEPRDTDSRWRIEKRWSLHGGTVGTNGSWVNGVIQARSCSGNLTRSCVTATDCGGQGSCTSGSDTTDDIGDFSRANAIEADNDFIYVFGIDGQGWRLEKREQGTGALDTTFGTNGRVLVPNGNTAGDLHMDKEYIYLVGKDDTNAWRVQKHRKSDGALCAGSTCDTGQNFGADGYQTIAARRPVGLAIDEAYMYIVGYSETANPAPRWRIEKRRLSDGLLCTSADCGTAFNGTGYIDQIMDSFEAFDVAVDQQYVYVVGDDLYGGWRIEKRDKATGALETAFGDSGIVRSLGSSLTAFSIAVRDSVMYIVGDDWAAGSAASDGRIERRFTGSNSADLYVEDTVHVPSVNAYSPYYYSPAVVGLEGISVRGNPAQALFAQTNFGTALYGYTTAPNKAGVYAEAITTATGPANTTIYGIKATTVAGKKGSFTWTYGSNALVGIVDADSKGYAVSAKARNNVDGTGIHGRGDAYAGYFEGDLLIGAGHDFDLARLYLNENIIRLLYRWCGSACTE